MVKECDTGLFDYVYREYLPGIIGSIRDFQPAYWACTEIQALLSDVTDLVNIDLPRRFKTEDNIKRLLGYSFPVVMVCVVRPSVDHLFGAFMVGALPLCFHPLRIIIESISYSYYIDSVNYEGHRDGLERLRHLDEELRKGSISFSRFVKEKLVDEAKMSVKLAEDLKKLWYMVSNDFLHIRGYIDKLDRWNKDDRDTSLPSWMVGAFTEYSEGDEETLEELANCIKKLRPLIRNIYDSWLILVTKK